jgi:hypothetical protein
VLEAQGLELDIGELVTWLDDAILFAPSMLLRPSVTWAMAGADAFDITLSDAGRTVQARVTIDDRGAPTDVSTTDRFVEDPYRPGRPWVRARWTTPVVGWVREGGRLRPSGVRAVWHLEKGEFPYVVADTGAAHVLYEPPRELVDAEMKRERLA